MDTQRCPSSLFLYYSVTAEGLRVECDVSDVADNVCEPSRNVLLFLLLFLIMFFFLVITSSSDEPAQRPRHRSSRSQSLHPNGQPQDAERFRAVFKLMIIEFRLKNNQSHLKMSLLNTCCCCSQPQTF